MPTPIAEAYWLREAAVPEAMPVPIDDDDLSHDFVSWARARSRSAKGKDGNENNGKHGKGKGEDKGKHGWTLVAPMSGKLGCKRRDQKGKGGGKDVKGKFGKSKKGDGGKRARSSSEEALGEVFDEDDEPEGNPDCTTPLEDCIGCPSDRLVRHLLDGVAGDVYCVLCWENFLEWGHVLEGVYEDNHARPYVKARKEAEPR